MNRNPQDGESYSFGFAPAAGGDTDWVVKTEPIAIIGIGCRFPGGVNGPDTFWRLLSNGVDAIAEVPADRLDIDPFYDPRLGVPGTGVTRQGGFLEGLKQFDPYFFGISPREADRMDPQQRLLLEVAWEALEDAGQVIESLAGSQTGVFIGMWINDYEARLFYDPTGVDFYMTTGSGRYAASGRLSYVLGFQGPSVTVDAACSSSLTAAHLACQSLWSGECELAVAGGVNVILQPQITLAYSQAKMLSPESRCKFGDARADGFVRSEGAGVIVLKPLSRALADADPVYAVIRGSAVNNDGRSSGSLGTPSRYGQEELLRRAYQRAGVSPGQVHYIEAHGTGTSAGDPIEIQALGTVLSQDRPQDRPCVIGSVKTNIGHTEGAAGIAGLIKVALCLKHRAIPASLHFQEPNPTIPWKELPLVVQQELGPWPEGSGPALAGVSAFGISGTNAHVVLQEAPKISATAQEASTSAHRVHLLPLSARSPEALEAMVRTYQAWMVPEEAAAPPLQDLCYTASVRRTHHDHRLALVVHNRVELAERLQAFIRGEACPGMSTGRQGIDGNRKIAFVFPGQGSQWFGMGRQLLEREPVFRESMELCARAIQRSVDWSLLEQLAADKAALTSHHIDIIQPTLFAMQVSLASLWRSWGVEPDAVVGHSMGEVAAAHVAGTLSLEDAARIICRRSCLLRRTSGQGAMAAVELSLEQAQEALNGYEDRVSIAVSNSSRSTVLSGDRTALEEIIHRLENQAVFSSWVKVDVASHSPQMDPLRSDLLNALDGLQAGPGSIPLYSTVTGRVIDGVQLGAQYWVRNLREPVLFSTAVRRLFEDGHDVFIEISAHPILLPAIQQELQQSGHAGAVLPSLRREEEEQAVMLASLGELYTRGYPIDWNRLYPTGGRCVRLPSYPWQRERCWFDDQKARNGSSLLRHHGSTGHPLLGQHLRSSIHAGTHFWEMDLSPDRFPYLADHRIHGQLILPGAAYVEMAAAAAAEVFDAGSYVLEKVAFSEALVLPKDGAQTVQLVIFAEMPGSASVRLLSLQPGDAEHQASWTVHASGTIRLGQREPAASPPHYNSPQEIQARCAETMSRAEHYQALTMRGVEHGAAFQGVVQLWRQGIEALAQLCLPETVASEVHTYQVHPALLDACFQTLVAAFPRRDDGIADGQTYLPVGLDSFRVYDRPDPVDGLWAYARCRPETKGIPETFEGDVFLLDNAGQVLLETRGLCLQRLGHDTQQNFTDWLYKIHWQPAARPNLDQLARPWPPHESGNWLIFADRRGVGKALASLLEARGETCVIVSSGETYQGLKPGHYELNWANPAEFQRLLKEVLEDGHPACRGVVHLWSLDCIPPEETSLASLEAAQGLGCISVLHLVQALAQPQWKNAPRLWLVTGGVQAVEEQPATLSVAQSPLWGLGSVIANEHPELRCTRVDFGPVATPEDIQSLFAEVWSSNAEEQVALRGNARYVARLVRCSPEAGQKAVHDAPADGERIVAAPEQNYCLETPTPGILDNLRLRAATRRQPGPGEVEIEVCAAGLNFLDVLKAMGICPGLEPDAPAALGAECAGKIAAVGKGVEHLQVGDEVIAITPSLNTTSCFSPFVIIPAKLTLPKPTHVSFEEAATIPITFLTAYYALYHLGGLNQGERVLIHAAAGGVGLAAVQLAQRTGAEIFATAGSEEKREFLRSLGIQHVMDSRSLAFADEVMACTGGEGVDIVLNSLMGEAIPKSLAILKPYGRFLEIGKRDIYQNSLIGLEPFKRNLSFFAIDLARLVEERQAFMASLLREVMQYFEDGILHPLPFRTFPISEVVGAFRCMAQARHIGKIVVSLQNQEVQITPTGKEPAPVRPDGTYLITGGLGGLGLTVAQWMVQQGACHLVLVGRSGASAAAQELISGMQKAGAEVVAAKVDVAQEEQVASLLAGIGQTMPPLRGVIHAAGILDDGILLHLNRGRLQSVMAPKMSGAWNLHTLTFNKPLDFFVLFSSVASCMGSPGQGNYAAANAFLDALAHCRRSQGRPALSINWGPWAEVGLAAAQSNRGERLMYRGLASITPEQGIAVLEQLLHQDVTQIAVMPFQLQQWCRFNPTAAASPLFATLVQEQRGNSVPPNRSYGKESHIREELLTIAPGRKRRSLLESHLQAQIAQVLRCAPARIDIYKAVRTMGLDSLMALEFRNRLEVGLGLTLSATLLWNYPTIAVLAPYLAGLMGIPLEDTTESQAKESVSTTSWEEENQGIDQILREVEQLSDDDTRRLLDGGA